MRLRGAPPGEGYRFVYQIQQGIELTVNVDRFYFLERFRRLGWWSNPSSALFLLSVLR
jgi:hypothetical protein